MHTLTIAFATPRHARDALLFLRSAGVRFTPGDVTGGEDGEAAIVDVEVLHADRPRLITLVVGLHGVVVRDRVAVAA